MIRPNISPENERQYELTTAFYDWAYKDKPDIGFYLAVAREMGGPVLEAGCGTGRILLPIAQEGINITGIDLSTPRLAVCRKKAAALGSALSAGIALERQSMVDFKLGQQFRLITIPFRGFQHVLHPEEQLRTLQNIKAHLAPGGYLVFDIFNPSIPMLASSTMLEEFWDGDIFTGPDGEKLEVWGKVVERNYNEQTMAAQEIYFVTHPDGRREKFVVNYCSRYTFRYELEYLLKLAGFTVENVFADFKKNKFGTTYPGDLIVFAKNS